MREMETTDNNIVTYTKYIRMQLIVNAFRAKGKKRNRDRQRERAIEHKWDRKSEEKRQTTATATKIKTID